MTAMLPMLLAAVLAATTDPASAPTESQIDRFMAVLPDLETLDRVDGGADPVELERLAQLNPGRDDEIRPVLEAFAACESPILNAMGQAGLRIIAQRLGSADLERLIAFYQSGDVRRLEGLMGRLQAGEPLGEAEQAEVNRIFAAYPLRAFETLMETVMIELVPSRTEELAALDRCVADKDAALARLDLETRYPAMPMPVPPPDPNPSGD